MPYICNIKPSGKHLLIILEETGGIPVVLKTLESKLEGGHMAVTGKTMHENLSTVDLVENDIVFPLSNPKNEEGGLAVLYGNLAPDGTVVKNPA